MIQLLHNACGCRAEPGIDSLLIALGFGEQGFCPVAEGADSIEHLACAYIPCPPEQQAIGHVGAKQSDKRRKILVHQLLLKGDVACRNDSPVFRILKSVEDCRGQICIAFSRASAGLDHSLSVLIVALGDIPGHGQLVVTLLEVLKSLLKQSAFCEYVFKLAVVYHSCPLAYSSSFLCRVLRPIASTSAAFVLFPL